MEDRFIVFPYILNLFGVWHNISLFISDSVNFGKLLGQRSINYIYLYRELVVGLIDSLYCFLCSISLFLLWFLLFLLMWLIWVWCVLAFSKSFLFNIFTQYNLIIFCPPNFLPDFPHLLTHPMYSFSLSKK